MSTAYIHRVLYLGIRHFVSPLAIHTFLPTCSHFDSLSILLCFFHLLRNIQIIHADSLLISLVSFGSSLLSSKHEANILLARVETL